MVHNLRLGIKKCEIPWRPRPPTKGLITGLLVVPSFASSEASTLAPAFVTGIFNLLFAGGLEAATSALAMLVLGAIFGLAAGLIWARLSTSRLEEN